MQKCICTTLMIFILFLAGCGSDSSPPPCSDPTAAQCLDDAYFSDCEQRGVNIETVCETVLDNHYNSSNREPGLVPELSGAHDTLREIYDVSYADQPCLYVPLSVVPETYYMRSAKFNLLNINDGLLATTTLQPLLSDLEFNPTQPPSAIFKSVKSSPTNQLVEPIGIAQPNYMFNGLGYNVNILQSYLDSLYTGKVSEWNDNEDKVESCEEYAYEKFYDFSLFKDYLDLHADDHLRIVEYAYTGSGLDESHNGIYITDAAANTGAIGTQCMSSLSAGVSGDNYGFDFLKRKGGYPRSIFTEMKIYYNKQIDADGVSAGVTPEAKHGTSGFLGQPSPDISSKIFSDLPFTKNPYSLDCDGSLDNCNDTGTRDFIPKNFFVEVLGSINKANQDRRKGIVLSNQDLLDLISADEMSYAMDCYQNNFELHFLMFKAAKRLYPDNKVLKNKLFEIKLLKKHLIQLMAERAYYEEYISFIGRFSERVLTGSETLPPSEKKYARMKLDERIYNPTPFATKKVSKAPPIDIIDPDPTDDINIIDTDILDDLTSVEIVLKGIDDQIEAVLLDAKEKGCFDLTVSDYDLDFGWGDYAGSGQDGQNVHNYATLNNLSFPNTFSNTTIDYLYDKAVCDWAPEMFTETVINLIPDSYYENVYADCMRITGGDFEKMKVDDYEFKFPSGCEDYYLFSAWSPNESRDYTENTLEFHKFETLVKKYPEALLDCDSVQMVQAKKVLSEADMNYYDPASNKVMMSKSRSYYDSLGGGYAGLEFGYSLGWLYEGYDDIALIQGQDIDNRDFVCEKTGFFAFGNYFAGGSFLNRDFTICSAGSYASNKTSGTSRPTPPTLADGDNEDRINGDINAVAFEAEVDTNYFMFIKNEKMTFNYDNGDFTQEPLKTTHSAPFTGVTLAYQSPAPDAQMITVDMEKSVPICGIISITIRGKVTGDIDASTDVNTDRHVEYVADACKSMNFKFTPHMDFDAFAQASVTAGISGFAGVSAGVETGLKFIGIDFPYSTQLSVSRFNGTDEDKTFNYDINVNVYNNLDQEITLLSGYFGAFVKIDYVFKSKTYRQNLFSWDGIRFTGNLDRLGQNLDGEIIPLSIPVKALYGLSQTFYQDD